MDRIARQTEIYLWTNNVYGSKISSNASKVAIPVWDAVANSMSRLAQDLKVRAVVVISKSGATAATMSSARPAAPIIAIIGAAGLAELIVAAVAPLFEITTTARTLRS